MDANLQGALSRRGFKESAGISNTLREQAQVFNGEYGKSMPNPIKRSKPQVSCHCERRILDTTWERIRSGAGESCGAKNCQPKEESQP